MNFIIINLTSCCFINLFLSTPCLSQNELSYKQAFEYIFKSKELGVFREEIRTEQGVIVKSTIVSDSVSKNDPYPFLCSILKRKIKNMANCSQLIGNDKLKTFDSIQMSYKGYRYSKKIKHPFSHKHLKSRNALVITFSDPYKNTLQAQVRYRAAKSLLFYFVFHPNGKIKKVYTAEMQNYLPY